ncbi:MAG TPA: hypothetical protein GX400_09045 [Chloroflexi bacterium]|nr:hypothetical protein [Chloroflexota bacterium]
MKRPDPVEHYVFVVRAWRVSPTAPWEFVVHYSGTDQVEYAQSQSELLSALNRCLQEDVHLSARQSLPA